MKYYSIHEAADELGLPRQTLRTNMTDVEPDMIAGKGDRFKFYSLDTVRDALIERHRALLVAVGFVFPEIQGQDVSE